MYKNVLILSKLASSICDVVLLTLLTAEMWLTF